MKKFFDEGCFYCGSDAHRRHERPKLSATLKAQGLRRVDGQWVAEPAAGDQSSEDWYLCALGDDDGGELRAIGSPGGSPPPPAPTGASARPPRARGPSRFAQATAWGALGEDADAASDDGEFPELGCERAVAAASATPRGQPPRASHRAPQTTRKAAARAARQVQQPAVQGCFKGSPTLRVVDKGARKW